MELSQIHAALTLLQPKIRKKRASEPKEGCGFQIDAMIFWTPRRSPNASRKSPSCADRSRGAVKRRLRLARSGGRRRTEQRRTELQHFARIAVIAAAVGAALFADAGKLEAERFIEPERVPLQRAIVAAAHRTPARLLGSTSPSMNGRCSAAGKRRSFRRSDRSRRCNARKKRKADRSPAGGLYGVCDDFQPLAQRGDTPDQRIAEPLIEPLQRVRSRSSGAVVK